MKFRYDKSRNRLLKKILNEIGPRIELCYTSENPSRQLHVQS